MVVNKLALASTSFQACEGNHFSAVFFFLTLLSCLCVSSNALRLDDIHIFKLFSSK